MEATGRFPNGVKFRGACCSGDTFKDNSQGRAIDGDLDTVVASKSLTEMGTTMDSYENAKGESPEAFIAAADKYDHWIEFVLPWD